MSKPTEQESVYEKLNTVASIAHSLKRIADFMAGDGKTSPLLRALADIDSTVSDCMPFPPKD